MNKPVFVSFVENNIGIANGLVQYLGPSLCWVPQNDLDQDKSILDQKLEAISNAKYLVLILSKQSNESKDILAEISHAFKNKTKFIILRIENIELSSELQNYLKDSEQFDVFKGSVNEYLKQLEKIVLSN